MLDESRYFRTFQKGNFVKLIFGLGFLVKSDEFFKIFIIIILIIKLLLKIFSRIVKFNGQKDIFIFLFLSFHIFEIKNEYILKTVREILKKNFS